MHDNLFTTKLSTSNISVTIYGLNEYLNIHKKDIDYSATVKINWSFRISEQREWGIKSFDITIHNIVVDLDWSFDEPSFTEGNITSIITNEHDPDKSKGEFTFTNEMELSLHKSLIPQDITIDFNTHSINIS